VTVLDLATVGPAARCTRLLADYGARVIKVGAPPRKAGVQVDPSFHAYGGSRFMKRVRVDLKADEGKALFMKLAEQADVVIESFRPGVVARLGVGYDDVRQVNPRIIYCSTSGYGQDGPMKTWAGHDINYLALGGYLHCAGRNAEGGPALPGATVADSAAGGMHAALAIMAALLRRNQTDEGEYLDVSVAEGVLSLASLNIDAHLATGDEPGPGYDILTGRYACYETYRAGDGGWLAVGAIEPGFYANLCKALGCEKWIPHQLDDAVQDEIRRDFRMAFAKKDRDEWAAELGPGDCCVAPVLSMPEIANNPHLEGRGAFCDARHPEHGAFKQVAPLLAGMNRLEEPVEVRPSSQTDSEELFREAGLPAEEFEKLKDAGIIA
jgi:alpha-methylacyl-CoA racemase